MNKEFKFEDGKTTCVVKYKNKEFYGEANCHPDDKDFESERVGSYIAELRADLAVFKYMRDSELIPTYNALNHIYSSFNSCAKYHTDSNEAKLVRRQLHMTKKQLSAVQKTIAELQLTLTVYIKDKEKFYQHVRKTRAKGQNQTITLS